MFCLACAGSTAFLFPNKKIRSEAFHLATFSFGNIWQELQLSSKYILYCIFEIERLCASLLDWFYIDWVSPVVTKYITLMRHGALRGLSSPRTSSDILLHDCPSHRGTKRLPVYGRLHIPSQQNCIRATSTGSSRHAVRQASHRVTHGIGCETVGVLVFTRRRTVWYSAVCSAARKRKEYDTVKLNRCPPKSWPADHT